MLLSLVIIWLPVAVFASGLAGLIYLVTQQNLRISANDPQIQLAEDAAARLTSGDTPTSVVPKETVDIGTSLATFITLYSGPQKVAASNARLDGDVPNLPAGVLNYAVSHGQDRVTWQPRTGIRLAIVAVYYNGQHSGVVVVGRSLREVEKRIDNLGHMVAIGWLITLLASLLVFLTGQMIALQIERSK